MITGQVNSELEAVIPLSVYGPKAETHEIEAVIDTGFSGHLTLPRTIADALQLDRIATGYLTLADDSEVLSDIYAATILWDGQLREVEADVLETETLVGMALLNGYDLSVRVAVGGTVVIKPSSPAQAIVSAE